MGTSRGTEGNDTTSVLTSVGMLGCEGQAGVLSRDTGRTHHGFPLELLQFRLDGVFLLWTHL